MLRKARKIWNADWLILGNLKKWGLKIKKYSNRAPTSFAFTNMSV